MWSGPPIAIPFRGLRLKRLYLPPAKRPDKRAEAAYLAAWYQIEQWDLPAAEGYNPLGGSFSLLANSERPGYRLDL
jgi:hypothetical protein